MTTTTIIPHGTLSAPVAGADIRALSPVGFEPTTILGAAAVARDPHEVQSPTAPPSTFIALAPLACLAGSRLQPILDVPAYLDSHTYAAPHYIHEPELHGTLPAKIKRELYVLLGKHPGSGAFGLVDDAVNTGLSITKAVAQTYPEYCRRCRTQHLEPLSIQQFRFQFDVYCRRVTRKSETINRKGGKDWLLLVNRSKAGAAWQTADVGLSAVTLNYIAQRVASYRRKDGKRQAVLSLHRQWETGRTNKGKEEPIAGYEDVWASRNPHLLPVGFSYTNILNQLKKRAHFNAATTALIQQGTPAALELLPRQLTTRVGLRFLERITIDDLRVDWLIFDPEVGEPCELWLLVARDHATNLVLGFVMHPRTVREDGTKSSIGLKEMKQLAAWILERYPLPPYVSHWTLERGTATISEGDARALVEMLPGHIMFHYTAMCGATSPVGYREKKKGNSTGKASHESTGRLFHTQGSFVEGQTGNRWDIRPSDLVARCDEAVDIWKFPLPAHLAAQKEYPLPLPGQAYEYIARFAVEQNFRTVHDLEGFSKVLECYDPAFDNGPGKHPGAWRPAMQPSTLNPQPSTKYRTRMERPVERAIQLMAPYAGQWTKCPPDVIIAFLTNSAHTITKSQVNSGGEITFSHGDHKKMIFAPPSPEHASSLNDPRAALLGYFNPEDPAFLHVTDGNGRWLGTWYRRARLKWNEPELLEQAMRYTSVALQAVQRTAEQLCSPRSTDLVALRAHNAELAARGKAFTDTSSIQLSDSEISDVKSQIASPVARAHATIPRARQRQQDTQQSDEALAASLDAI